jgi:formylmethanofuran dehydrogenase subunit E
MIPDYWEADLQEIQQQRAWDEHLEKLPTCAICGHKIMDCEDVHEARGKSVCTSCMEELTENVGRVEVD